VIILLHIEYVTSFGWVTEAISAVW